MDKKDRCRVANAIYFMHHNFTSPIIHQDLLSKNILLDLNYEAHISDFDMVIIRQLLKS